jgi:AhpD family alkylhydroperoxidase
MINGYKLIDPATATGDARKLFERAETGMGFVPNLINSFAESPVTGEVMLDLYAKTSQTGFTPLEVHIVFQAASVLNQCLYCVPAHSTSARKGGVPEELDQSLRANQPLDDPKHEALRAFTEVIVEKRGRATTQQFDDFINAGWTHKAALEVVLLVSIKTLTNYANHLTNTDIDEKFQPQHWRPSEPALV